MTVTVMSVKNRALYYVRLAAITSRKYKHQIQIWLLQICNTLYKNTGTILEKTETNVVFGHSDKLRKKHEPDRSLIEPYSNYLFAL